ncbi:MAG: polysaccharide biosynthesis/export family protein [Planctomycetes bacterium]|nr:polysaccharide biosynthesis/export family protein [Planctomycetota bacterium]
MSKFNRMAVMLGLAVALGGCSATAPVTSMFKKITPEPAREPEVSAMAAPEDSDGMVEIDDRSAIDGVKRFWSRRVAGDEKSSRAATGGEVNRLHVRLGSDGTFVQTRDVVAADTVALNERTNFIPEPELDSVGGMMAPGNNSRRFSVIGGGDNAEPVLNAGNYQAAVASRTETQLSPSYDEAMRERGFNPDAKAYLIRPGDTLEISIPYEDGTMRQVPVRPDGRISYLFDIELMAAGRTYAELREILKNRLSVYYKNPRVTVIGKTFEGNSVFVMGPVAKPGAHTIQNNTKLLDVLSNAGVLSLLPQTSTSDNTNDTNRIREVADLDGAYLARGDKILDVDFRELLIDRKLAKNNVFLEPGDFIFVPSSYGTEKKVYICGRVRTPQVYYYTGSLSFMEAILEANGTDADSDGEDSSIGTANVRSCYIIRGKEKTPIEIDWWGIQQGKTPDVALANGDILYVPERKLSYGSRVTSGVISEILKPLQSILDSSSMSQAYYQRNWQLKSRGKARNK